MAFFEKLKNDVFVKNPVCGFKIEISRYPKKLHIITHFLKTKQYKRLKKKKMAEDHDTEQEKERVGRMEGLNLIANKANSLIVDAYKEKAGPHHKNTGNP